MARFLRAGREAACADFNVVLSPDYNAAHRNHFHLDMGPGGMPLRIRRRGEGVLDDQWARPVVIEVQRFLLRCQCFGRVQRGGWWQQVQFELGDGGVQGLSFRCRAWLRQRLACGQDDRGVPNCFRSSVGAAGRRFLRPGTELQPEAATRFRIRRSAGKVAQAERSQRPSRRTHAE